MWWFAATSAALIVLPVITRLAQASHHRGVLATPIGNDQESRDSSRTIIIALAGFSFTGVVGIAVLESATRRQELQIPVGFFLVSFLLCLFALQLENYKFFIGRELLSTYLTESAILMLLIAIVAIVWAGRYGILFKTAVALISYGGWLTDHFLSWRYMENYLRLMEEQCRTKEQGTTTS